MSEPRKDGLFQKKEGSVARPKLLGVEPTINAVEYRDQIPSKDQNVRNLYMRAAKKQASPRQAIKAMCQQCIGYENRTAAIKDCRGFTCPLYQYRPFQ